MSHKLRLSHPSSFDHLNIWTAQITKLFICQQIMGRYIPEEAIFAEHVQLTSSKHSTQITL
jgi:hypothetical protein